MGVVHVGTDLSAGFHPLFAPAAQPALSAFPGLKGSQMLFFPRGLVQHSLCSVWGKGSGLKEELNYNPSYNNK